MEKEEILTYQIIQERKKEQERLISEGKMETPKIVYGFTPEDRKMFDEGLTFEQLWDKVEQNLENNDS